MTLRGSIRALAGALLLSCSQSSSPGSPVPAHARLASGVVATVGPLAIEADTVSAVSRAQELAPHDALAATIRDALLSLGARSAGLDRGPHADAAERAVLARARLQLLKYEASAREPGDDEVAEATQRHFVDLDRPPAFRVIHAVVRVSEKADPPEKARARALAERLAERVAPAKDEAEFRALAESVDDRGKLEIVVETLKPVAADGRVVDVEHPSAERYALPFARAASHLSEPGQKSGIVVTEFGFHVMMLLDRTPAHTVPLEERRDKLRDEIFRERARQLEQDLVRRLRDSSSPTIERSADALLSSIDLAPHESP